MGCSTGHQTTTSTTTSTTHRLHQHTPESKLHTFQSDTTTTITTYTFQNDTRESARPPPRPPSAWYARAQPFLDFIHLLPRLWTPRSPVDYILLLSNKFGRKVLAISQRANTPNAPPRRTHHVPHSLRTCRLARLLVDLRSSPIRPPFRMAWCHCYLPPSMSFVVVHRGGASEQPITGVVHPCWSNCKRWYGTTHAGCSISPRTSLVSSSRKR